MRIQRLNHSIYQLQYHIVWGTKYRRKILKKYVRTELVKSMYRLERKYPEWQFVTINTDRDHVHIQIECSPKYAPADVVRQIKISTSKRLRKRFKYIDRMYNHSGVWSVGYFISSIGINEEQIRKYIQTQGDKPVDVTKEFS